MNYTVQLFFCLLLALSGPGLMAQSAAIRQLEQEAEASNGTARIRKLLQLSDQAKQEGLLDRAMEWAADAAQQARRDNAPELRAQALNKEGHLALLLNKIRRAAGCFEQSLASLRAARSSDKTLALDNLEQLRTLATQNGKDREASRWSNEIATLTGQAPSPAATSAGGSLSKAEMRDEITQLSQEIVKLSQQPGRQANGADSRALQAKLAEKEATISLMSEEQAKNGLVLAQQQMMLDSLLFKTSMDSLAHSNTELALQKAESESRFTYSLLGIALLLVVGATIGFIRARQNAKLLSVKNEMIRAEQERSENLLLNILPALVADELKKQGHTDARYFEDVGVLFADFVGFSRIAEKLSPQQLVNDLDTCFRAFDEIISRYGLEKIKTIGDAYMCAGGLPNGDGSKLRQMVQAAREMQSWLANWNLVRQASGLPRYEARIGIHAGPVVAGVVGSRKFAFDIWGDTVNIASRIEAAGEGGKINISGNVHHSIKDYFTCEYRGKIPAKNKGEIDMYFVNN